MKNLFIAALVFFFNTTVYSQFNDSLENDAEFYNSTNKWFSAWELISKEVFKINKIHRVEFVFFDERFVYSTSSITIKKGKIIKGNNLLNINYKWKKELHGDSIILPNNSKVPIGIMSFAGKIGNKNNKSFFIMPLPSYWKKMNLESYGLGTESLITGIFLHEFSHSQQMKNFGKKVTEIEERRDYGIEFNDDIIQNLFEKDSSYQKMYNSEVKLFYQSIQNKELNKDVLKEGLIILNQRQSKYFNSLNKDLVEADNLFLTMEGLGQFVMYLWLTHPKGGNLNSDMVINGVRRNRKWWSQDEGFALFLILERLAKPEDWIKSFFGNKTESVIAFLWNYQLKNNFK